MLISAIETGSKCLIVMNPTPFCIPLLNVKRLSPSLIKLFPGLKTIFTDSGRETFWNAV